jgi:hypothetical protein
VPPTQVTGDAVKESADAKVDPGPLVWFVNLTMEGGPLTGRNVFALQFRGMNKSSADVKLKTASIVSGIGETNLPLEIVIGNEIAPLTDAGPPPRRADYLGCEIWRARSKFTREDFRSGPYSVLGQVADVFL